MDAGYFFATWMWIGFYALLFSPRLDALMWDAMIAAAEKKL